MKTYEILFFCLLVLGCSNERGNQAKKYLIENKNWIYFNYEAGNVLEFEFNKNGKGRTKQLVVDGSPIKDGGYLEFEWKVDRRNNLITAFDYDSKTELVEFSNEILYASKDKIIEKGPLGQTDPFLRNSEDNPFLKDEWKKFNEEMKTREKNLKEEDKKKDIEEDRVSSIVGIYQLYLRGVPAKAYGLNTYYLINGHREVLMSFGKTADMAFEDISRDLKNGGMFYGNYHTLASKVYINFENGTGETDWSYNYRNGLPDYRTLERETGTLKYIKGIKTSPLNRRVRF